MIKHIRDCCEVLKEKYGLELIRIRGVSPKYVLEKYLNLEIDDPKTRKIPFDYRIVQICQWPDKVGYNIIANYNNKRTKEFWISEKGWKIIPHTVKDIG